MEDLSLDDILAIFKRRRMEFAVVFAGLFTFILVFALQWSHYRATTTVQIMQPYVSSGVTNVGKDNADLTDSIGLADRRINQIEQKVTSDQSLVDIASKLNLYPGIDRTKAASALAGAMRSHIRLDFVTSQIANPAAVQKESLEQLSAIAFTLSFDYSDPVLAKQGLDAIVQAFIDEEAAQRIAQAKQTADFLDGELEKLDATIADTEQKIAAFRAEHGESGPSAVLFNQQAMQTNSMSLETLRGQIAASDANISSLRTQLIGVSPYMAVNDRDKTITSGQVQLPALEAQYAQLTTRYGPEHPDVKKVAAQIAAMRASGTTNSGTQVVGADNPVYVQINTQLAAAQAQRTALQTQIAALQGQQLKYEGNIAKNPAIESQMSQLTLDLDNQKDRYHTLKDKRLAAEMQMKLESGSNRELLKVINATTVPTGTSPSRKIIILAGLMLAFFAATMTVIVREALAQSVRGAHHLAAIVGVAPLVSVPHLEVPRG